MAIYKLFPEKDATIYTQNPTMNTGLDEILEASTYLLDDAAQTSRYLIKFSQDEINGAYTNYVSGSGVSYLSTTADALLLAFSASIPTNLTNTTYSDIGLTSSTGVGIGARVDVTTTGNTISGIDITNRGKNYKIGDTLKISNLITTTSTAATASIVLVGGDFIPRDWQTNL